MQFSLPCPLYHLWHSSNCRSWTESMFPSRRRGGRSLYRYTQSWRMPYRLSRYCVQGLLIYEHIPPYQVYCSCLCQTMTECPYLRPYIVLFRLQGLLRTPLTSYLRTPISSKYWYRLWIQLFPSSYEFAVLEILPNFEIYNMMKPLIN